MVGGRLARRVGRAGVVGRLLGEKPVRRRATRRPRPSRRGGTGNRRSRALRARGPTSSDRAAWSRVNDPVTLVRMNCAGSIDRPVDVRLSPPRCITASGRCCLEDPGHLVGVADVDPLEVVAGVVEGASSQARRGCRRRSGLVDVDDLVRRSARMSCRTTCRTDEPGASGHKDRQRPGHVARIPSAPSPPGAFPRANRTTITDRRPEIDDPLPDRINEEVGSGKSRTSDPGHQVFPEKGMSPLTPAKNGSRSRDAASVRKSGRPDRFRSGARKGLGPCQA